MAQGAEYMQGFIQHQDRQVFHAAMAQQSLLSLLICIKSLRVAGSLDDSDHACIRVSQVLSLIIIRVHSVGVVTRSAPEHVSMQVQCMLITFFSHLPRACFIHHMHTLWPHGQQLQA